MNILMVSPTLFPDLTGNAVSVHRISEGLKKLGHTVKAITPADDFEGFVPDVVHAFHAFKSARADVLAKKFRVPLVVTMTGTDGYIDLADPQKRNVIAEILFQSSTVAFYSDLLKARVVQAFPKIAEKAITIGKGMPILPESEWDFRAACQIPADAFVFTMLGSIRPVKNTHFALNLFAELRKFHPHVYLAVVGSIIDESYGEKLKELCGKVAYFRCLDRVQRENVRQVFAGSDVILNCSEAESESNTLIEAMLLGKTVLASGIEGNSTLLGSSGVIYKPGDEKDFLEKANHIVNAGKKKFLEHARRDILQHLNPLESEDYARVYEHSINTYNAR